MTDELRELDEMIEIILEYKNALKQQRLLVGLNTKMVDYERQYIIDITERRIDRIDHVLGYSKVRVAPSDKSDEERK